VKRRRRLLLAILVYITLDLSLAAMPGAFVFDAAQSVESPHSGRGRGTAEILVRAVMAVDSSVPCASAPVVTSPSPAPTAGAARERVTPRCLPRAAVDTASPSDDPH
jgi:hypothetical protein